MSSPATPPTRISTSYRAPLRALKEGDSGPDVRAVQLFLAGKGLYSGAADGSFGPFTRKAVIAWQTNESLTADGWIGNRTWGSLISAGCVIVSDPVHLDPYPPEPDFMRPLANNDARHRRWGRLEYRHTPVPGNAEAITITNCFEEQYIVRVVCPASGRRIPLHREVAPDYLAAMQAIIDAGLLSHIDTFDGWWVPRFQRGSRTALSAHAWGTAFDINASTNGLGRRPARPGQPGCVYALVPILARFRFWWGGHFRDPRKDGMHFEHVG